jgi:predicted esterase
MKTKMPTPWIRRGLPAAIVLLLLATVTSRAQEAGQVLGTSVRFGTLRNSVEMTDEVRTEVDRLQRLAGEANAARKYGDALKHLYHGIALMQKQPWTPARALSGALILKPDRLVVEPGQSLRFKVGQIYQLDEKPDEMLRPRLALFPPRSDEKAEPLKVLLSPDPLAGDFIARPYAAEFSVPEIADGSYRLTLTLSFSNGDSASKSVSIRVERGLAEKIGAAKARTAKIETNLKTAGKDSLLGALSSAQYWLNLIDLVNSGEVNVEAVNFANALSEAGSLLSSLEAGVDPYATRKGDIRKAYRSKADGTLQPYRLFIPSRYDGTRSLPLVIALHGMGGNENSYFEAYANGAIKQEAEKRGYIIACPKGRAAASMYMGLAEKDVLEVLGEVQRAYRIDPDRIYLTGHSMGGFGTWSVAINNPEIFAALAPIAGGGNPAAVKKIAHIPQLVVHGAADKTVLVARSRTMVAAAKEAGTEVKYIEVPDGSHVSIVVPTFKDVFDWFDAHARKPVASKAAGASPPK